MDLYQQIFFTTLAVSFGILHFIIYLYNRKFKSNLFFAIFLFLYALNVFFDFQASLSTAGPEKLFFLRLHRLVMPYNSAFALLFLYYAFDQKIPKYFWLILSALAITGFFAMLEPMKNFDYVQIPQVAVVIEAIRIFITTTIKNKKHDAWIIASGFTMLFLFSLYDLLLDLGIMNPVYNIENGYQFGFLFLIISASVYLARDFARVQRIMLEREVEAREMLIERKILEAEDSRKARELNEARDLQLSLLPGCITNIGNYDFCFEMRTASEVGGDYYDYSISEKGEITLVIGDATDHGMKAGMMVSIIKSLFLTHVNSTGIKEFLNSCSRTIKQMKLKNLYMALMLVKINGARLTFSSAGIPPLLIHRKKSGTIEEFKIKGMPLGSLDAFPYEIMETDLDCGDTVLLLTDGLPDLFNEENQPLGNEKIKRVFMESAALTVSEILGRLLSEAENWMKDRRQNDDITLVAFRLKEEKESLS